jgi:hypothetical protein
MPNRVFCGAAVWVQRQLRLFRRVTGRPAAAAGPPRQDATGMRNRLAALPLEHRLGVVPHWEQVSVAPSHR